MGRPDPEITATWILKLSDYSGMIGLEITRGQGFTDLVPFLPEPLVGTTVYFFRLERCNMSEQETDASSFTRRRLLVKYVP